MIAQADASDTSRPGTPLGAPFLLRPYTLTAEDNRQSYGRQVSLAAVDAQLSGSCGTCQGRNWSGNLRIPHQPALRA